MITEHVYVNSLLNLFFKGFDDFLHTSIIIGADGSLSVPGLEQTALGLDPDVRFNYCTICQRKFTVHKRYICTRCHHHFCHNCVREKFISPLETIPGPVCYLCQSTFSSGFDSLSFLNIMLQYDLLLHPSPHVITTSLRILQDRLMHPQYRMALSTTTYADVYSQLAFLTERSCLMIIKELEEKNSTGMFHQKNNHFGIGGQEAIHLENLRAQVPDPLLHSKKTEKILTSFRIKAQMKQHGYQETDILQTELKYLNFMYSYSILEGCLGCLINLTTPTASSSNNELQELNMILADASGKRTFEKNLMMGEPLESLVGNARSLNTDDVLISDLPTTYKFRLRHVASSGIPKICRQFLGRIRVFDIPKHIDIVTSFVWIVKNLSLMEHAQFEDNSFSKKITESLLELGAMHILPKDSSHAEEITVGGTVVGCVGKDDWLSPNIIGLNRNGQFELYKGVSYSLDAKIYNNLLEFSVCAFVNIRSLSSDSLSEVALSAIDVIIQKLFKWAKVAMHSNSKESFNSAITAIICILRCWHDKSREKSYRETVGINDCYVWNSILNLLYEGLENGMNYSGMNFILVSSAFRMTIKEYIKQKLYYVKNKSNDDSIYSIDESIILSSSDSMEKVNENVSSFDEGVTNTIPVKAKDFNREIVALLYSKKMVLVIKKMLLLAESSDEWGVELSRLMCSLVALDPKLFSKLYHKKKSTAKYFDSCFKFEIHPIESIYLRLKKCLDDIYQNVH